MQIGPAMPTKIVSWGSQQSCNLYTKDLSLYRRTDLRYGKTYLGTIQNEFWLSECSGERRRSAMRRVGRARRGHEYGER
jgi:hypothetical protein